MNKIKVFVSRKILEDGLLILDQNRFSIYISPHDRPLTRDELIEACRDVDVLISMLTDKIDASLLDQCPKLKLIANYAVGLNNIDLEYCREKGIKVLNTPDVLNHSTAETALLLMIACARKLKSAQSALQTGTDPGFSPMQYLGFDLRDKTLGIYGMGRIGRQFAKMAHNLFNMQVIYFNRTRGINQENMDLHFARQVSFEELLAASDVVSIHAPLNEDSRGRFDYETLLKMKRGSLLINTGRGEIIKTEDLTRVMCDQNGRNNIDTHFFAVGLDVTSPEPLDKSHPLLQHPDILILPHIGSATKRTRSEMSKILGLGIQDFFALI